MTLVQRLSTALALVLTTLIAGPAPAVASEPTTERNRQFIAQAFNQWAQGGRTFFTDVLSPDVIWTIKGTSPSAGTYRGRDDFLKRAVQPFAKRLASPVRPTVTDIWAEGDDVVVHWDGIANAADGAPYRNSYVWIMRMRNLQAVEVTAFLDLVPYDDVIRRISLKAGDVE